MTVSNNDAALARLRDWRADAAIVLGSGLSEIVTREPDSETIAYSKFRDVPPPSVPGHAGQFVLGKIGKLPVIFAQGRVHLYEGHTAQQVTSIVRILAEAAVKTLILTNAAGSINPKFSPGHWMMIGDHINLTGTSPLQGAPLFVDLTDAYSKRLQDLFAIAARETETTLHRGVYAGLLGPQYETPAEVRMLRKLGADAVGMSTVLETIQARALGLEVAGFSCLTNFGAGLSTTEVNHEEVLVTGKKAAAAFSCLLDAAFSGL